MNKDHEYEQLSRFVGKWNTAGRIPQSDGAADIRVNGTDTYEWLPGGFFLLHKVNVLVGDEQNETTEIIGWDALINKYTMQHYDNKGNSGFMTAEYKEGIWTFSGEKLRFSGGFKDSDREFSGVWEQLDDDKKWVHFMDIKLTRNS